MFSWFKKHFIPHSGNNHRPHLLHGENARLMVISLLIIEALTFFALTTTFRGSDTFMAAVLPSVLGDLTNSEREELALNDLAPNSLLNESATLKAQDMAEKGYFAHTSPEGKTPWYWIEKVGYEYEYAGENLAVHFSDSADVTEAWMNSPAHRANIEKAQYTEIGTGIATGMLDGVETIFVAQVYAKPAVKVAVADKPIETVALPAEVPATPQEPIELNQVLGASVENTIVVDTDVPNESTFAQRAAASPRHTANNILFAVGAVVIAGLVLTIVFWTIQGKMPHYDILTNGLLVIMVIGLLYVTNIWLSQRGTGLETTFTSFSATTTK